MTTASSQRASTAWLDELGGSRDAMATRDGGSTRTRRGPTARSLPSAGSPPLGGGPSLHGDARKEGGGAPASEQTSRGRVTLPARRPTTRRARVPCGRRVPMRGATPRRAAGANRMSAAAASRPIQFRAFPGLSLLPIRAVTPIGCSSSFGQSNAAGGAPGVRIGPFM